MTEEELKLIQIMCDNCLNPGEYEDPDRLKKYAALQKLSALATKDTSEIEEKVNALDEKVSDLVSLSEDKAEDSFTIKTSNFNKARLFCSIEQLMNALIDIKEYRRELYKGYSNDVIYMTQGHTYERLTEKKPIEIPKDHDGSEGSISVVEVDDVIRRIDNILSEHDIWRLTDEY